MTVKEILAKILFCDVDSVGNVLMHIPVGLVNIAIGIGLHEAGFPLLGASVAFLFGYGFMRYELDEQRHLGDKAYKDIHGWLWGLGILGVPLLITGV